MEKMKFSNYNLPDDGAIASITFEDIRWQYGVFRCNSTGSGRDKRYFPWRGVKTALGEIEEKDWCKLAESLIEFAGETDLLKYLLQWYDEHKYPQSSAAEVRKEALQLHTARIFDNPQWVGFVPFNTKYRPTALETAHIVLVRMDCCPEAGSVTQEQIDHAYEGQISCPHCGRWNNFTILKKEIDVDDDSPWETDCEI